jgi:hypothetical protein
MAQSVVGEFREMATMSKTDKVRLALLKLRSVNSGLTASERDEMKELKSKERMIK